MIREADTNGDGEIGKFFVLIIYPPHINICRFAGRNILTHSFGSHYYSYPSDYEEFVRMLS